MGGSSHQTVRIARGRHRSPDEGACVMELASMLAGEDFSDRPQCVDPVIAAFMRSFNDRVPEKERQRLYPYAAAAVGTKRDRGLRAHRRGLCLRACGYPAGRLGSLRVRARMALSISALLAVAHDEPAAELAARRFTAMRDFDGGFRLLDELLAAGGLEAAPLAGPVPRVAKLRVPSGIA